MAKEEGVKTAVVGGLLSWYPQHYSGTVGGQSTNFAAIDSEIKSTKHKDHALAPPDFIGNGYQGLTWRLGFGIDNKAEPEEWQNHEASDSVPLTLETYVQRTYIDSISYLTFLLVLTAPNPFGRTSLTAGGPACSRHITLNGS
jgi:hypothetical protein